MESRTDYGISETQSYLMTNDETNPESSPSLAGGFLGAKCTCHPIKGVMLDMQGKPFCRLHEVQQWKTSDEIRYISELSEKELDDRALAAACGLMLEFHIGRFDCFRDGEFQSATGKEIAAILRPFLQSKPKPTP